MASVDSEERVRRRLTPQARREAILAAALAAFTSTSYDRVTLGAVGAACGASEALVFKYFENKAGLYAAVVGQDLNELTRRIIEVTAALPPHSSARDEVARTIDALLDHVEGRRVGWASPFFTGAYEPESVQHLRLRSRSELVARLTERLRDPDDRRNRLAVVGFLGHLGAAAEDWVQRGCPSDDRGPLVEAALGALEGGLGDWGSLRSG